MMAIAPSPSLTPDARGDARAAVWSPPRAIYDSGGASRGDDPGGVSGGVDAILVRTRAVTTVGSRPSSRHGPIAPGEGSARFLGAPFFGTGGGGSSGTPPGKQHVGSVCAAALRPEGQQPAACMVDGEE